MNIKEEILNLIFPPVCSFCGKIDRNCLCEDCKIKLKKLEHFNIDRYNKKDVYFNEHIYLFQYENFIREQIINYKFNNKPYYYMTFEKIFINNKKICDNLKSYDIIVSVPMHNKKKRERGYNQTEIIAKQLSKDVEKQGTNLKYVNSLNKTKNNTAQSLLNKKQRIENAKNAYSINETEIIKNKRILIFDDIFTTGSTANECAKILKKYTNKKIGVLTIAKD